MRISTFGVCALAIAALIAPPLAAQDEVDPEGLGDMIPGRPYSPYADRAFPTNVYFGDTHVHTGLSADAGGGGTTLMPRDSYRFARGEQVTSNTGQPVRLSRPFDFYMITDHSDGMGLITDIKNAAPAVMADPMGKDLHDKFAQGGETALRAAQELTDTFAQGKIPDALNYQPGNASYKRVWDDIMAAAEEFNDPGVFTTFIAYEWTSLVSGNNLHRNVIFRDGPERAGQIVPYSTTPPVGSRDPRDLWKWLQNYEDVTGGDVTAIPHNGNLSNGMMFALQDDFADGAPYDPAYAEARAKWERLYESNQIKGDGETHPFLSPEDEFADFEIWDYGNLDASERKTPEMLPAEYVRSGLQRGLMLEDRTRHKPVQVRAGRGRRHAYRALHAGPGQLLRQVHRLRAEPGTLHPYQPQVCRGRHAGALFMAVHPLGPDGGLGREQHARRALRRDGAARGLCHHRLADPVALLRRLGVRGHRRLAPRSRPDRLHQGRADGHRPSGRPRGSGRAVLPRLRAARPDGREPRPGADHQGMARR